MTLKENEELLTIDQFNERIDKHKESNKALKLLFEEANGDFREIRDYQQQMFLDYFNARMFDTKVIAAPKHTIIDDLRLLQGEGSDTSDGVFEDIYDLTLNLYKPEGYVVEVVESEFEDYGRWSNYKTDVYKVTAKGTTAYFELGHEVPASEMQDGQDCSWHFTEVFPKEVTTVVYVHDLEEANK